MSKDEDVPQGATWWAVTVDCEQPQRVAEFWAAVFECEVIQLAADRPGWFRLQPRGTAGPFMNFQPVVEPNEGKVRIHVDVLTDDIDDAVTRIVVLGGSDTGARENLPRGRIAVMRDPEGHEFCLLAPPGS